MNTVDTSKIHVRNISIERVGSVINSTNSQEHSNFPTEEKGGHPEKSKGDKGTEPV